MSVLTVHHSTVYRYRDPIQLGEHRMMFRPRESYDLRLIQTNLVITPEPAQLRWLHDPVDNSVAVATFQGTTSELRFESTVTLEHFETSMPEYPIEAYARTIPFRYSDEDFPNLEPALAHHYPSASVSQWALQFLDPSDTTATIKILSAMTCGIRQRLRYTRRVEKGVQTPEETLRSQRGSCRDFAVLMMEAARSLGNRGGSSAGISSCPTLPAWPVAEPLMHEAGLSGGRGLDRLLPHQTASSATANLIRVGVALGSQARAAVVGHLRGFPGVLPRHGRHGECN